MEQQHQHMKNPGSDSTAALVSISQQPPPPPHQLTSLWHAAPAPETPFLEHTPKVRVGLGFLLDACAARLYHLLSVLMMISVMHEN